MDPKDNTNNQTAAGTASETNQELNLVGNFLPIEYVGDKFPPSPPLEYSSKHVGKTCKFQYSFLHAGGSKFSFNIASFHEITVD